MILNGHLCWASKDELNSTKERTEAIEGIKGFWVHELSLEGAEVSSRDRGKEKRGGKRSRKKKEGRRKEEEK